MGYTQPAGTPMVARGIFGTKGVGTTWVPRYAMRPHRVTERRDDHTDHYVDGRFAHRETRTSYSTRIEDRMAYAGVEGIEHQTIEIDFEDVENERMEIEAPWWGLRGDLVYVASHRGVGSYVYDVHSNDGRHVQQVRADVVRPIRLRWPALAGLTAFMIQTEILHLPMSYVPAMVVAGGWLAVVAVRRTWLQAMLWLSRRRARAIVRTLVSRDAPRRDEIRSAVRARVSG